MQMPLLHVQKAPLYINAYPCIHCVYIPPNTGHSRKSFEKHKPWGLFSKVYDVYMFNIVHCSPLQVTPALCSYYKFFQQVLKKRMIAVRRISILTLNVNFDELITSMMLNAAQLMS